VIAITPDGASRRRREVIGRQGGAAAKAVSLSGTIKLAPALAGTRSA